MLVVIIIVGPIQDATFGLILIANSLIGIVQEVRAKRTLDQLAVLNAPRARVVRDGAAHDVAVEEVVLDDLLELRTGDQVSCDGVVRASEGLEVDESLLTGESDPLDKAPGDEVLSTTHDFFSTMMAKPRSAQVLCPWKFRCRSSCIGNPSVEMTAERGSRVGTI